MAVTGVGVQTSLYITLLLILPPCYHSLPICHSVSISFPLFFFFSLPLRLVCLSFRESLLFFFFFPLPADCCGPRRRCCVLAVVIVLQRKKNSQLFYFFSSSRHNIPPMLKGLDYFGVTSLALSFSKSSLEEEQ